MGVCGSLLGLAAAFALTPGPVLAAPTDDQTTYQVNAAHTGAQGPDPMTPPLTQQWSFDAGSPVLNPMIAGGTVFFTADNFLYAKDPKTGADVWGPVDLGWQGTPTYDGGRIFVSGPWGMLRAFDAGTGAPVWTVLPPYDTSLPYVYQAPVAYKGILYVSGAQTGGAVTAVRETDGSVIWTHSFVDSVTLPAVTDTGLYVSHATQWAYDLNPATGAVIWSQTTGTQGGGTRIDAVYAGRDYVEDAAGSRVFDAGGGTPIAYPFPSSFSGPAFDGNTGFFIDGYSDANGGVETLKAQDLTSGAVTWSFTGDNGIDSPPLVVNGYVYARSKSGNLYAIRESDGSVAWTGAVGANTPWYQSTPIAAGESLLLVPSGNKAVLFSSAQTVFGSNPVQPAPSPNPPPSGAVADVAYQVNSAHEGNNPDTSVNPPLSKKWSRDFGHQVSYALVAQQHIYVVSADGAPCYTSVCGTNPPGDELWALDESSGATVWGPVELGANRWFANAVYDQGRIITVNDRGDVAAYDAGTGVRLWTRPVQPYQPVIDGIPVARNGIVYITDQTTSRLYAIRDTDGADLWSAPSDSGEGSPAVTDSAVYVTHACDLTRAFNATTGAPLWARYNGCRGGGGTSPAVHGQSVFARGSGGDPAMSLDAASGSPLAGFTADGAPAFDGNLGFFPFLHQYAPKILRAEVTASSRLIWSFVGDGSLISDPIVVNGVVYIGSARGMVYGLRERDGGVAWSDNAGQPLTDSHEWNSQAGTVPVAGLSAGDGMLLVPASNLLAAYATSTTPTPTPTPTASPPIGGGAYRPLNPARILDTRDGTGGHLGALGAGQSLSVPIANRGNVPPTGASAVVLNVTATDTTSAGYLTVYPSDVSRPTASNLNWTAGETIPNLVEVMLGQDGAIKLYNAAGSANVVIDVEGWVSAPAASTSPDGWFNPLVPARLLDTRDGTGSTVAPIGSGGTISLQVSGRGGVPLQGSEAVVINVTATNPTTASYLTVWPEGTSQPTASNLNFARGQTIPNRAVIKLGPTGKINLYNAAGSVDAVVDVNGWFTAATPGQGGNGFIGVTPNRILDTRDGTGGAAGPLGPGVSRQVTVAGANAIPSSATAVVANLTVTDTTGWSYLTVWPDLATRPTASDLNWVAGQTVPNLVVVGLGTNGKLDIYNAAGSTDVILDVVGYYR